MKGIISLEFETVGLASRVIDDIIFIKFKNDVFETMTDLAESERLLNLLEYLRKDDQINALIISNEPESFGAKAYDKFIIQILHQDLEKNHLYPEEAIDKISRSKQINILNHVILYLIRINKITVAVLNGEISTPFFGASLAMDFRFVSEDMEFVLSHRKFGLHPTGGLPYFLPRYIGHGKAMEYLLTGQKIPAQEALKLNLVNAVLPQKNFDQQVIERIKAINQQDFGSIGVSKRLAYFNRDEIIQYFEMEMEMFN
jgi:2-(1,2-epoxy-1,2-dihydrophenyl)acetyl-CoA isomerase